MMITQKPSCCKYQSSSQSGTWSTYKKRVTHNNIFSMFVLQTCFFAETSWNINLPRLRMDSATAQLLWLSLTANPFRLSCRDGHFRHHAALRWFCPGGSWWFKYYEPMVWNRYTTWKTHVTYREPPRLRIWNQRFWNLMQLQMQLQMHKTSKNMHLECNRERVGIYPCSSWPFATNWKPYRRDGFYWVSSVLIPASFSSWKDAANGKSTTLSEKCMSFFRENKTCKQMHHNTEAVRWDSWTLNCWVFLMQHPYSKCASSFGSILQVLI